MQCRISFLIQITSSIHLFRTDKIYLWSGSGSETLVLFCKNQYRMREIAQKINQLVMSMGH